MSFEISGRIVEIYPEQQVTDRFKKREFVLEVKETGNTGMEFVEFIKFQTVQDKCTMLDNVSVDDRVKVSFNLKGRKWEKGDQVSYFTNLDAWRVENEQSTTNPNPQDLPAQDSTSSTSFSQEPPADDSGFDDLPF